mgnify:CR=1 FL=1
MNQLKKIELSDAAKYSINLAITVTGLANPPLGVILGICNSLGNYRSNEKVARINFVMEKFIDLIKDEKSEEEFINEIAEGKLEPIFMDFLETNLRKVSIINSADKRMRFAYLLDNAYRFRENTSLFDNLNMFSDILEKTSDYQLQILIAHYDKNAELKAKLKLDNESLYKANLNYLMSMELLVKDFSSIIADLPPTKNIISELGRLFIEFIKEYEE